jgi:hypothetical protein
MESLSIRRPTTTPSNLQRRFLCPGSARLEAPLPDEDSTDARKGRLLHRYWTNPNLDRAFLSADDRDLLELGDRLLNDVLNRLGFETIHDVYIEHSMISKDGRLPGKPDQVYLWTVRRTALVNDLKTGFAIVEGAELNLQLRGYAVIVADNFEVDDVYVSILQPRLFSPAERITLAHYDTKDIKQARTQIQTIIAGTEEKDAPLRAGETQCRYCKAKLICPAFRSALALPVAAFRSDLDLTKAAREAFIEQRLKQCNDEQLEQVIEACSLADHVAEPARDEARSRIQAGLFTNYFLGKEYELRNVTNVRRAIAMLALAGVASREDILDICRFSLKTVEERYRDKHVGMTWQQAREKINRVLASVIERETGKPKLLRKK